LEIKGRDALKMAKCYMNAFYRKPSIPRKLKMGRIHNCVKILGNDVVSMDEAMIPHLAFSENINQCLEKIKDIVIY